MESLKVAIFAEIRRQNAKYAYETDNELNSIVFHNVNGLRLTFRGFLILKNIFTVHSFEVSTELKAKHHIGMSKMEYPFYFTAKRLMLFSEMDAMLINLHGGIDKFLETCFNIDR